MATTFTAENKRALNCPECGSIGIKIAIDGFDNNRVVIMCRECHYSDTLEKGIFGCVECGKGTMQEYAIKVEDRDVAMLHCPICDRRMTVWSYITKAIKRLAHCVRAKEL